MDAWWSSMGASRSGMDVRQSDMDASMSVMGVVRVRKRVADHLAMKAKSMKSPALTEVNEHFDERYERFAKHMDHWFENRPDFPHGHRGAVFCWLWDNHKGVVYAMERHWLPWDSIALIAAEDGVQGRWNKPPTGNAMRRVWGRVCQEMKVREKRKR